MRYLVTGGCGFVGSNLACALHGQGEEVHLVDNLSRHGSRDNLAWLRTAGLSTFREADTRDLAAMEAVFRNFRPEVILHLAGQVAMTTSLADPRLDFESNVLGGFNILECARRLCPDAIVIYSSTNKVYGDLEQVECTEEATRYTAPAFPHGFDESLPLDFRSPYGCSKGATDQYMLEYARTFGLRTVVFRHSSIFGGRQFSTYDQGWIGWFVKQALEVQADASRKPFTISGNGKQVRDVLFVSDLVDVYLGAVRHIERVRGRVFNMGGGMANSLSLLELFAYLEQTLDLRLSYAQLPWRQSDQKVFVADIRKAQAQLEWAPRVGKEAGLRQMIEWTREHD